MYLSALRLRNVGPFDDVSLSFTDAEGAPRPTTVIVGASGVGKTTLLQAIAVTRPGLCTTPPRPRSGTPAGSAFVVARYRLGDDDPSRPHDLVVASIGADFGESVVDATVRKREQALFDRLAGERGFCVVALPSQRWASRAPVGGVLAEKQTATIDPRAVSLFDDATRADFAREVKQAIASAVTQAAIADYQASLAPAKEPTSVPSGSILPPPLPTQGPPPGRAGPTMHAHYRHALATLLSGGGSDGEVTFEGIDPATYEPLFRDATGRVLPFDDLSAGAKNRVVLATVPLRRLAAAYPSDDPTRREAIVLIDNVEAMLPDAAHEEILDLLRRALPKAQLIVTTQSPRVVRGRAHDEIIVLSRDLETSAIAATTGRHATLH